MNQPRKKLGELLVEAGIIDEYQLRSALSHQQQWGGRLGKNLVDLGLVSEERIVAFLAKHFRLPAIDFKRIKVMPAVLKLVSPEIAKKHNVMPLFLGEEEGKKYLAVAMSNPADIGATDELEFAAGRKIRPVVAADAAITAAIRYYYDHIGPPPYDEHAKSSSDMVYSDLIKITREYLKGGTSTDGRREEQTLNLNEREIELDDGPEVASAESNEDDSLIVFTDKGEKAVPLTSIGRGKPRAAMEASAGAETTTSAAPSSGGPSSDQVLRALISVLIDKGVISRDEIKAKLRQG